MLILCLFKNVYFKICFFPIFQNSGYWATFSESDEGHPTQTTSITEDSNRVGFKLGMKKQTNMNEWMKKQTWMNESNKLNKHEWNTTT